MGRRKTYLLRLGHKAPIHERVEIGRVCAGIDCAVSWHNTDVAIVLLIEATSFDDCYAMREAFGKSDCQSQASCATADYDIVKGVVVANLVGASRIPIVCGSSH